MNPDSEAANRLANTISRVMRSSSLRGNGCDTKCIDRACNRYTKTNQVGTGWWKGMWNNLTAGNPENYARWANTAGAVGNLAMANSYANKLTNAQNEARNANAGMCTCVCVCVCVC